eukprot:g1187.t1
MDISVVDVVEKRFDEQDIHPRATECSYRVLFECFLNLMEDENSKTTSNSDPTTATSTELKKIDLTLLELARFEQKVSLAMQQMVVLDKETEQLQSTVGPAIKAKIEDARKTITKLNADLQDAQTKKENNIEYEIVSRKICKIANSAKLTQGLLDYKEETSQLIELDQALLKQIKDQAEVLKRIKSEIQILLETKTISSLTAT